MQNVLGRIAKVEYQIPGTMSAELRDLLARMLVKDPSQRIGLPGIMAHPWFLRSLPPGLADMNARMDPDAAARQVRCAGRGGAAVGVSIGCRTCVCTLAGGPVGCDLRVRLGRCPRPVACPQPPPTERGGGGGRGA